MDRLLTLTLLLITLTAFAQLIGVVNGGFEGDADDKGVADGLVGSMAGRGRW